MPAIDQQFHTQQRLQAELSRTKLLHRAGLEYRLLESNGREGCSKPQPTRACASFRAADEIVAPQRGTYARKPATTMRSNGPTA